MKTLKECTMEELHDEIKRRNREKKIPKQKTEFNLIPLRALLTEYMSYLSSEEYHEENDYEDFIYEKTLETFYGEDVWELMRGRR